VNLLAYFSFCPGQLCFIRYATTAARQGIFVIQFPATACVVFVFLVHTGKQHMRCGFAYKVYVLLFLNSDPTLFNYASHLYLNILL
jgi:hypothetical protein